ncbi:MAG: membrane protein insertion efficiency factor YidD [Pseudomonadales bacterium]|nr:membrane protein insertion efficiency factor YidD [Pseudomonadales bacterium]MCP5216359.1 membrane protein insertion efficiency factor YidD [Pseudomonadales bacterium]
MRRLIISLLKGYRYLISPLLGNNCRFYPSCSCYAETAISRFGLFRGGWLSLQRLSKCHPWHSGGIDQVPDINPKPSFQHRSTTTDA